MNLSKFLSTKCTSDLIINREKNSKVLIDTLNKNKGTGVYKYDLNNICFDVITYNNATECIIIERYIENGHDKYLVKHLNSKFKTVLRNKDLILK